jgi:hypothetical protein
MQVIRRRQSTSGAHGLRTQSLCRIPTDFGRVVDEQNDVVSIHDIAIRRYPNER